MTLLTEIQRSRERAEGMDLARLAETSRDKSPAEVAAPKDLAARREFLRENLGDARLADLTFERIIEGNELQPVNYLELGMLAGRAICRIRLIDDGGFHDGWATGFLIAPGVLLTNNHVFPSAATASRSVAQFDVELDIFGGDKPTAEFRLEPDRLFFTAAHLDFAVVAVAETGSGGESLAPYGFLPLVGVVGKVVEGEWLTIIQHPGGERKQVCVRENRFLTRTDDVLWYSTDTLGGSSGSPVFNNSWQVVALHHKGVPEEKDGRIQTVDGRDFDPGRDSEAAIKWIANEGVRVSRIVQTLKAERPDHPLLADVFEMTPARAREVTDAMVAGLPCPPRITPPPTPRSSPEMSRSITVTLDIADDGSVSVRGAGASEAAWAEKAGQARTRKPRPPEFDVPFDTDYAARKGYQPAYLDPKGKKTLVPLPVLGPDLQQVAAPLLPPGKGAVLDYDGYSLVMHKDRRLAIYTAANVNGADRFALSRPSDDWRFDPRISRNHQVGNFYYQNNKFDRGHLTRREDMEYGATPVEAIARAADTCHWTNCTPQHSAFNQNKALWQGLERHVLESSVAASVFAAQVFTGAILDEGDPVWDAYPDIQYPVRFWKVAAALTSANKLFAAGFILDQSEVIAEHGIEVAVEVPFGAFKTFQVPIADIERETGLTFPCVEPGGATWLRDVDPMRSGSGRRRSAAARVRATESLGFGADIPEGYVLLEDGASIVRPD